MTSRDDAELLAAWRDGDGAAGNELFERHFVSVFRFFASKLGDVVAQDLTQRAFERVIQSRDRVRDGSRVRAYMLAIARNELLMFLRARGRHGVDAELERSCVDELLPSPASALAGTEQEQLIVRALRRIPLELQMALELYYWEELSTEEIADVLGIPRGTVKSRLFRAREQVRDAIEVLAVDRVVCESSVRDFEQWVTRLRDARPPRC
jgi:RNA polymerase sigma-70 factor (ECF subfamily)